MVISILLYTIVHARQMVQRRHCQPKESEREDCSSQESNGDIREELDSNYSFISEEYRSNSFESDVKLTREAMFARRSRSDSQAAVQTMLHLMAGKKQNGSDSDEMKVSEVIETFEGKLDPLEQVRSNSFPTISLRKRSSRLWSLQSVLE